MLTFVSPFHHRGCYFDEQADKRHTVKLNKLLKSSYTKEAMETLLNPNTESLLLSSNWKVGEKHLSYLLLAL